MRKHKHVSPDPRVCVVRHWSGQGIDNQRVKCGPGTNPTDISISIRGRRHLCQCHLQMGYFQDNLGQTHERKTRENREKRKERWKRWFSLLPENSPDQSKLDFVSQILWIGFFAKHGLNWPIWISEGVAICMCVCMCVYIYPDGMIRGPFSYSQWADKEPPKGW